MQTLKPVEQQINKVAEYIVDQIKREVVERLYSTFDLGDTQEQSIDHPIVLSNPKNGSRRGRKPKYEPEIIKILEKEGEMPIKDISDRLGATGGYAYRCAKRLEDKGLIKRKKGVMYFTN